MSISAEKNIARAERLNRPAIHHESGIADTPQDKNSLSSVVQRQFRLKTQIQGRQFATIIFQTRSYIALNFILERETRGRRQLRPIEFRASPIG